MAAHRQLPSRRIHRIPLFRKPLSIPITNAWETLSEYAPVSLDPGDDITDHLFLMLPEEIYQHETIHALLELHTTIHQQVELTMMRSYLLLLCVLGSAETAPHPFRSAVLNILFECSCLTRWALVFEDGTILEAVSTWFHTILTSPLMDYLDDDVHGVLWCYGRLISSARGYADVSIQKSEFLQLIGKMMANVLDAGSVSRATLMVSCQYIHTGIPFGNANTAPAENTTVTSPNRPRILAGSSLPSLPSSPSSSSSPLSFQYGSSPSSLVQSSSPSPTHVQSHSQQAPSPPHIQMLTDQEEKLLVRLVFCCKAYFDRPAAQWKYHQEGYRHIFDMLSSHLLTLACTRVHTPLGKGPGEGTRPDGLHSRGGGSHSSATQHTTTTTTTSTTQPDPRGAMLNDININTNKGSRVPGRQCVDDVYRHVLWCFQYLPEKLSSIDNYNTNETQSPSSRSPNRRDATPMAMELSNMDTPAGQIVHQNQLEWKTRFTSIFLRDLLLFTKSSPTAIQSYVDLVMARLLQWGQPYIQSVYDSGYFHAYVHQMDPYVSDELINSNFLVFIPPRDHGSFPLVLALLHRFALRLHARVTNSGGSGIDVSDFRSFRRSGIWRPRHTVGKSSEVVVMLQRVFIEYGQRLSGIEMKGIQQPNACNFRTLDVFSPPSRPLSSNTTQQTYTHLEIIDAMTSLINILRSPNFYLIIQYVLHEIDVSQQIALFKRDKHPRVSFSKQKTPFNHEDLHKLSLGSSDTLIVGFILTCLAFIQSAYYQCTQWIEEGVSPCIVLYPQAQVPYGCGNEYEHGWKGTPRLNSYDLTNIHPPHAASSPSSHENVQLFLIEAYNALIDSILIGCGANISFVAEQLPDTFPQVPSLPPPCALVPPQEETAVFSDHKTAVWAVVNHKALSRSLDKKVDALNTPLASLIDALDGLFSSTVVSPAWPLREVTPHQAIVLVAILGSTSPPPHHG